MAKSFSGFRTFIFSAIDFFSLVIVPFEQTSILASLASEKVTSGLIDFPSKWRSESLFLTSLIVGRLNLESHFFVSNRASIFSLIAFSWCLPLYSNILTRSFWVIRLIESSLFIWMVHLWSCWVACFIEENIRLFAWWRVSPVPCNLPKWFFRVP